MILQDGIIEKEAVYGGQRERSEKRDKGSFLGRTDSRRDNSEICSESDNKKKENRGKGDRENREEGMENSEKLIMERLINEVGYFSDNGERNN